MTSIRPHFADSNIYLSVALPDKSMKICSDYLNINYERHTSDKVTNEINNVLDKLESVSKKVLIHIRNYIITKKIPDENVYKILNRAKKDFLKEFEYEKYPLQFERNKFNIIIKDLFNKYSKIIENKISSQSCEKILNDELEKNSYTFGKSRRIANKLLKFVNIHSFTEINPNLLQKLININIHKSDALILIDCFNTSKLINKDMIFITKDRNIIKNKENILKIFHQKITVCKPEIYIDESSKKHIK